MLTDKELEKWEPIKKPNGIYEVSNFGRVRSLRHKVKCAYGAFRIHPGKVISLTTNKRGYLRCNIGEHNNFKTREVHRLIALSFIPNPLNKPCVNHKNGNKLDNRIENMEWCTHKENCQHAQDTGLNRARYSLKQKEAVKKIAWKKGHIPWNKNKKGSQVPWNKGFKKGVLICH